MNISTLVAKVFKVKSPITEDDVDEICKALEEGHAILLEDGTHVIYRHTGMQLSNCKWRGRFTHQSIAYAIISPENNVTECDKTRLLQLFRRHAPNQLLWGGKAILITIPEIVKNFSSRSIEELLGK